MTSGAQVWGKPCLPWLPGCQPCKAQPRERHYMKSGEGPWVRTPEVGGAALHVLFSDSLSEKVTRAQGRE